MAKNPLQNIFGAIGGAVQGAGNFIGNEVQQFSPAVQNFASQAARFLGQQPQMGPNLQQEAQIVQGAVKPFVEVGQGVAHQGLGYFNPNNNTGAPGNPIENFWNTNTAKILAGQQRAPTFNFAEQDAQNVQSHLGNNALGRLAGLGTQVVEGIPEAIMNVPSQVVQSSIDTAHDVNTGQFDARHALGDAAELANPLLTVATMGEGGSIIKSLAKDTWKMGALKGLLNGTPIGGAFGLAQGLSEHKDAANVSQQFQQSIPNVLGGMLFGGTLGTLFGPAGKLLFGGKTGEAAALSERGLVPPQAIEDAYKILNVHPNADLGTIRNSYTQALQEFHPNHGGTDASLQALNSAYEMVTRNHAPTVSFDENGAPFIQFSDKFGGKLTPQQQATARKAIADNESFQQRIAQLKGEQWPEPQGKTPQQAPIDQEDSALGLNMLNKGTEQPQGASLTDQELGQLQLQQKNPQLQYPEMQTQNLRNLVRVRDGLHAQIKTDVPDAADAKHLLQLRDGTQKQIDQAQVILKNYDLYQKKYNNMAPKTAIRSQVSELRKQVKNIDLQVNDSRTKIKAKNEEQNNRIQLQLKDLEKQINDERVRVQTAQSLAQPALEVPSVENAPVAEASATMQPAEQKVALKAQPEEPKPMIQGQKTFTGRSITEYDPTGVLKPHERRLAETLLNNTLPDYGVGRDLSKTLEERIGLGEMDIKKLNKGIIKELKSPESRTNVLYALDNSVDPRMLTPEEKNVYDRMQVLHQITFDVAQKSGHPDLQPIENYAPSFAKSIDKNSPYKRSALSTSGPQVIHRDIRVFTPADGGEAQIGTKEGLGLTESGKSPGVFEDANGTQYLAKDATMKQKEGLGIQYETDLANAEARHMRNVIRAKENFGVREAVKGENYTQLRSNPGQPLPAGFKKTTIQGLEHMDFKKMLRRDLSKLFHKNEEKDLLLT
jgi:regulator of replication initiation timing